VPIGVGNTTFASGTKRTSDPYQACKSFPCIQLGGDSLHDADRRFSWHNLF
jgi:hypothetical protein